MYVAPNKNLPGLKARSAAARKQHEAAAKAAQVKANADAIAKVAGNKS